MLLQQLAIALFSFKQVLAAAVSKKSTKTSTSVVETKVWPTVVNIMLSSDGQKWTYNEQHDTNLAATSDEIKFIRLRADGGSVPAKFIRIVPVAWCSADGSKYLSTETNNKVGAAMRVGVQAVALSKYTASTVNHVTLESANIEGLLLIIISKFCVKYLTDKALVSK